MINILVDLRGQGAIAQQSDAVQSSE